MSVVISADDEIKNISDYRIERTKQIKVDNDEEENNIPATTYSEVDESEIENSDSEENTETNSAEETENYERGNRYNRRFRGRRSHYDRRRGRNNRRDFDDNREQATEQPPALPTQAPAEKKEGKIAWWRKLIG